MLRVADAGDEQREATDDVSPGAEDGGGNAGGAFDLLAARADGIALLADLLQVAIEFARRQGGQAGGREGLFLEQRAHAFGRQVRQHGMSRGAPEHRDRAVQVELVAQLVGRFDLLGEHQGGVLVAVQRQRAGLVGVGDDAMQRRAGQLHHVHLVGDHGAQPVHLRAERVAARALHALHQVQRHQLLQQAVRRAVRQLQFIGDVFHPDVIVLGGEKGDQPDDSFDGTALVFHVCAFSE
ncbi:Uncharacterised protein [Bordetella pertussis]|nr:Uncharacterised protein [Bordetella pertussis]CFL82568.1 Uncharacterised protein [Bordetella pertussis]CFM37277.1 Uncharacterised protein [Bordetella pertussis]CFM70771.1 Uncharacterised protein [Bordetella pertussis]CFM96144.1 Uncharacterised protein [Bordetella pertussis]